ncbi:MAG: FlgD immunoglobulin-like domain containing protein [Bacteroidota bacterium]
MMRALLLALLATGASAQDIVVSIVEDGGTGSPIPVVGLPAEAQVAFRTLRPTAVSVLARPVGETAYQTAPATDLGGGVWTVSLPFEVPRQGIEAYASYTVDGRTLTEPAENPEGRPFRVPSLSTTAPSDVTLPARQYRMVSVPLVLGDDVGAGISLGSDAPLDVFGDDYGPDGDPEQWRLLRWDPTAEAYRDAIRQPSDFVRVRPGAGYWLATSVGGPFDADFGISAGSAFEGAVPFPAAVSIRVRSGWNQIGSPFLIPVRWTDVERPAGVEDPVAFNGSYVGGQAVLQPWEGYFVFNPGPEGQLVFRVGPPSSGGTDAAPLAERLRERATIGASTLTVRVDSEGVEDEVILGLGQPASGAPINLRKPPAVTDGLRIVARDQGEEWLGRFRPHDQAVWTLAVRTARDATLHLSPSDGWPEGLLAEDVDRGVALAVASGRITLPTLDGVATRTVRLRLAEAAVSDEGIRPALGTPRPNPSAGGMAVPFSVPSAGPVTVTVYDVLGRAVRTLDMGAVDAGTHTARWDGRDGTGQPVAAGVYVLRLSTDAGTTSTRVTRL